MTAQGHLDRLSAVDAGFLHQEDTGSAHMHIGGIAIFEGPVLDYDAVLEHIGSRLHLMPRYRQKIVTPPFQSGRPLWVDDPDFSLGYHVRQTALPAPGGEEQLLKLAARVFSERLDRTKPLWEVWLVEGLEDGRIALLSKTHHAVVDGISGIEMFTALFDLTPETTDRGAPASWHAQPTPGTVGLLAANVRDNLKQTRSLVGGAIGLAAHPLDLPNRAGAVLQGLGDVAMKFLAPAPDTPLNGAPGPHRRVAVVREQLSDFKAVKDALGGTVNDVVLTVVTGALARFLEARGVETGDLQLRGCVPVSIRPDAQRGVLGNAIIILAVPLPVGISDPVRRLARVRSSMDELKKGKQALGVHAISQLEEFAPPTLLAQASRLGMSSKLYNVMVTNVPGPQFPIYLMGHQLVEVVPLPFLAPEHRLCIAVMSYLGQVSIGLLGDYDALPDLDVLAKEIDVALEELVQAARRA